MSEAEICVLIIIPLPVKAWAFYVSGSGALLLNFRHQGAGSPMTSTLCPVVCDLPSAPPSSPSHLNYVGTPPAPNQQSQSPPPPVLCVESDILCATR